MNLQVSARRWGKNAALQSAVTEAEEAGHWVVVIGPRGALCSRCQRAAEECTGGCMSSTGDPVTAGLCADYYQPLTQWETRAGVAPLPQRRPVTR